MPGWAGSDRRARLPANWEALRLEVLDRDRDPKTRKPRCRWEYRPGQRCSGVATEVDHIKPNDDHSLENLRGLCTPHHRRKSGQEGAAATNRKRAEINQRFRRTETHPGLR